MKKLFTLITSVLLGLSIYAQWSSFPGTASDISCASNTDLVCINNYPNSSLRGIYKYNPSNGVWEVMTSGGDFTNASIASDGTIWGRSALNFGANSNLIKFNSVPAVSLNYSAVSGLLDNISASSSSAAIGSVTSQLNNIYRTTTTANTFSLLPLSAAFSAKKVVYASNGDLACINWASSGNNVFKYTTGTGWSSVSTSLPIFATDIAIGQNNQFQMAIVSGGNLYVRYNNEWLLDQTAPPNITKVTVAPNGRVFILTSATSNNIYNRFYDNIICANILTPPTNLTPTANLTVCSGATTTLVSSAAGSNTYWYDVPFGQTQNPIGTGTSFITPPITQTTTYYVGYYSGGCYSPLTPITVNVPTNNAGTLAGNQSICVGLTSTFTSTISGGTWSTSNGSIATVNNSGLVTAIGPGTATITYTINGSGSCPSTSTRTITVLPAANAGTLSGNQTICSGTSAFSSTVPGGTWSSSNTSIATVNSTTGVVTGVSQGMAVITYSVSNTCGTATATRSVTIASIGAVTIWAFPVQCVGTTNTFTSSPSGGVWSSSDTSVATVNTSGLVTGVSVGQTTISYSFQGVGCPGVSSVLNVTAGTNAGTLSGAQTVCLNSTTTFSSTVSGGTWSSSNTSIATVNASGVVTGLSAGTATITYTVAGSGSCSNGTATRMVTVSNGPAAPVNTSTAANLSKCAGSTATLTATGSGTISWYSDAAATNLITTGTSYTTPVLNATTYYYLKISGSFCPSAITTITVTINQLPSQPVNTTPTASLNICSGNSTTLTATTSANAVVTWYSSTGSVLGTGSSYTTGVLSNNTTIVARAEISGSPCVSDFTAININVTPAPVAGNLSGTQAICTGSTTNFSSTVSGGSWSSSNNTIASVNASGVVTGVAAGTATITYTVPGSGSCPGASATRTVTVTAAPNAGIVSGAQSICFPGTTTFSTTGSGGTWSSSNNAIATVNASGVVSGVSVGTATITYTVTGTGGCASATATRTVTVENATTPAVISGDNSVCLGVLGSTLTLSTSVSGGIWTVEWPGFATINQYGEVSGIAAGTVNIVYTLPANGSCAAVSTYYPITINSASPNTTINETICFGETFILNGLPYPNQGTFGQNFPNSNGCDSLITLNLTILPEYTFSSAVQLCVGENYDFFGTILTTGGNYSKLLTAASGCDSVVNLNLSFVSQINTTENASICAGENYSFGTQNLSATGVYTETFLSVGGCDSIVALNLNVLSLPNTLVVTQNAALLSANSGFDTYAWYSSANPSTILGTNASFTATASGSYYVEVEAANGCTEKSAVYDVVLSGIENLWNAAFSLAPNPARNLVTIENLSLGCIIKLSAITGQTLFETNVERENVTIDLTHFSEGLYLVCLYENGVLRGTKKLVVTK